MAKKKPSKAAKPAPSKSASRKPAAGSRVKKPAEAARARRASAQAAYAEAVDPKKSPQKRREAFAKDPTELCRSSKTFASVLKVLRDPSEPIDVRLSAFEAVGAARFSAADFESCRAEYIAALREVAEDEDPELRQRALGMLAREKDGFAQKKLLAGLKNPDKALVSPEKALQLLGYDIHTDAYAYAREIVAKPPNSLAKQEALRLLASDPTSAPLLEKVLRDKNESVEDRQISAAALHSINPSKYQDQARELLLDEDENPDIQAMSMTALNYFGGPKIAEDKVLLDRVDELAKKGASAIKPQARQVRSKYQ